MWRNAKMDRAKSDLSISLAKRNQAQRKTNQAQIRTY